jgi:hypothetical protein
MSAIQFLRRDIAKTRFITTEFRPSFSETTFPYPKYIKCIFLVLCDSPLILHPVCCYPPPSLSPSLLTYEEPELDMGAKNDAASIYS